MPEERKRDVETFWNRNFKSPTKKTYLVYFFIARRIPTHKLFFARLYHDIEK